MKKRILAALLAAAMVINLISFTSYAGEPHVVESEELVTYEEAFGAPSDWPMLFAAGTEEPSYYFKAYNQLEWQAKKIYDALEKEYDVFRSPEGMVVVPFDPDEIPYATASDRDLSTYYFRSAVGAFDFDHPESYWLNKSSIAASKAYIENAYLTKYKLQLNTDYTNMLNPAYGGDLGQADKDIAEVEQTVSALVEEAESQVGLYNKLRVVNDYLTDENYYNRYVSRKMESTLPDQSPIRKAHAASSALTEQTWLTSSSDLGDPFSPVCEGYARAFKMVCDKLGIPCIVASGNNHMWNYVYDEDGDAWYGVDTTWNDPVRSDEYAEKITPARDRERYLLVGSETVNNGYTFGERHVANAAAWEGGTPFDTPVLSESARKNESRITFDLNGGEETIADETRPEGGSYGELPVPERKAYEFLGWFTDRTEGTKVKSEDILFPVEDRTLYARWQAKQYKITFNAGEGACGTKEKEVTFGTACGELPVPERKGYEFLGWFTGQTEGTEVKAEHVFSATEDQVLHARWRAKRYKVIFDAGEGTCGTTEKEVAYDAAYGELPVPEREAYEFLGWFTEQTEGTEIKAGDIFAAQEDQTLYAHWQEKPLEEDAGDSGTGGEAPGDDDAKPEEKPEAPEAPEEPEEPKEPEAPVDYGDVLPEDIPEVPGQSAEECIPANLWIAGVKDMEYTGSAITQTIRVYDGKKLLNGGSDYTLSYSGNIHAGQAAVTVTCKGNYTGVRTVYFKILPKSLSAVTVDRVYSVNVPKTGGSVKILQSVKDGGKVLKGDGQDYSVSYRDENGRNVSLTDISAGSYHMILEGCGDYAGILDCGFLVAGEDVPAMGSARIVLSSKSVGYGESAPYVKSVTIGGMTYTAYSGPGISDLFRIEYPEDAASAGSHEIMVHSVTGRFAGAAGAGYTVKRKKLTADEISIAGTYSYAGKPVKPQFSTALREGTDYTVTYSGCDKAGKAVASLKGIGNYTGTLKLYYAIAKGNLETASVTVEGAAKYDPSGAKPLLAVSMGGNLLRAGTDYTVSYQDNRVMSAAGAQSALAVLKGKGSFTGTKTVWFSIEAAPVTEAMIAVADRVYSTKSNAYRQPVTVKNGKTKLKEGRDYTVSYSSDGQVTDADMVKGYHDITVTVTGKAGSGYTGSASRTFTVYDPGRRVSRLRVSVREKAFTGEAVILQPEDVTVTDAMGNAVPGEKVTVLSYKNNVKAGAKASAVIKVQGYGGTKTVKFRIGKKKIAD